MPSNIAAVGLRKDLLKRKEAGLPPIRIGVIGVGEMGTDIVTGVSLMEGIEIGAIVDRSQSKAHIAAQIAYQDQGDYVRYVSSSDQINNAIEQGKIAAVDNSEAMLNSGLIDVVVDATGIPSVGAEIGLDVMEAGKHLVMMNVEADVTIGAYLRKQAERLGVVYTLGAGDEPSSTMEILEFVSSLGLNIICAGKGKNNPLNIDATPDLYEKEAIERNMNPRMLVEFVDGSKTMVEMACIANATGLVPDIAGMHGPAATPEQLTKVLIPEWDGGILSDIGRVDYSVGKGLAPGVFVIAKAEHPRIWERMADLKVGEGPYFSFIRPYHLTSLEVPLSCARAVLYNKADMVPLDRPVAEVCAKAKKDLHVGDKLDQIGEYCYRSFTMKVDEAKTKKAHPVGMLSGAKVISPVKKGELITADNVSIPHGALRTMREAQDKMIYGE